MPYAGQRPFGDIYSVPTPERAVNAIAEKIYREKLMQDQQRRMEEKALDDDFGKNIARVKSVDVPEISQAYNEFKQAHIGLQKKGSQATPEDQMAVLLAKAKVDEKINGSVEDKEYLKLRANEGKSDKKGRYNPDFNLKIQGMLNTPTSKRNRDLDDDALLSKYSFPDLTKVIGDAVGKGEEVKIPTGRKSIKGDLYNDENVYKKINDPNKVYNTLYTGIGSRPDHINFSRVVLDSITDQEAEELKTRYFAKINDPIFKAIYGEVKPFPESAGNTDLGKAVAIKTMQAVDVLPLDPIRTDSKLNTDAVMDKRAKTAAAEWDRRNKITFGQSMQKIAANKAAGQVPDNLGYVSDEVVSEYGVPLQSGKTFVDITNVDPERIDIITNKDLSKKKIGVQPVEINMTQPDGSLKRMKGYYVDPATGDWEGKGGQKVSREAAKDRYIQSKAGTKFKAQSGTKGSENTKDVKDLDPNGFKREGKYWKYKDGRLFDDKGNVIKQ